MREAVRFGAIETGDMSNRLRKVSPMSPVQSVTYVPGRSVGAATVRERFLELFYVLEALERPRDDTRPVHEPGREVLAPPTPISSSGETVSLEEAILDRVRRLPPAKRASRMDWSGAPRHQRSHHAIDLAKGNGWMKTVRRTRSSG